MKIPKNRMPIKSLTAFPFNNHESSLSIHSKTMIRKRTYSASSAMAIFSFFIFGIIIFSSCKKEIIDVLPEKPKTNMDSSLLKAGTLTYYIDPNGNDAATGDITHPWRSLSYACSRAKTPGTIIHVKTGTFFEKKECVLAVGVSIEGEGATKSIIKTDYVYSSKTSVFHGLITIDSYTINTPGNQHISGIGFDGTGVSYRAIINRNRGNVSINNCSFTRFVASAVIFLGPTSAEKATPPAKYVTGNSFHHNNVTNCSTYNMYFSQSVSIFGQDGFHLNDNTIRELKGGGVSGDCVYSSTTKRFKVYNNTFERGNYVYPYWNFAVELRWHFGEFEFYNNRVTGAVDICYVYKNATAYGAYLHDNVIGFNTPAAVNNMGFHFEADMHNVRVIRNIIKNTNDGISFSMNVNYPGIADSVAIVSNLLQNIGQPGKRYTGFGIQFSGSKSYSPVPTYSNIMIYNNDIIGNGYSHTGIWITSKGHYNGIKIKNNIIAYFDTHSTFGPVRIEHSDASQIMTVNSLMIDRNLFYSTGNSNNLKYSNITPTATTQTNTIKLDPKFVNRSALDYRLQSTSPAINQGINLGIAYKSSAPDLGALEY